MPRRKSRMPFLPRAGMLPPNWKLDAVVDLPEKELRAWHSNMEDGLDLRKDDILLSYKIGSKMFHFPLSPRRLTLPDGSQKVVDKVVDRESDLADRLGCVAFIKACIIGRIVDRDVLILQPREMAEESGLWLPGNLRPPQQISVETTTYARLVEELIEEQFSILEEKGVERSGYFTQTVGGLKHMENPVTDHTIFVDINKYNLMSDGRKIPDMISYANVDKIDPREIHLMYHNHWPLSDNRPSWQDLELIIERWENSVVIAARREPRTVETGSYNVTEWRPKEGVPLPRELRRCRAGRKSPDRYDPDKIAGLIDDRLERRDFLLVEDADRMKFTPS